MISPHAQSPLDGLTGVVVGIVPSHIVVDLGERESGVERQLPVPPAELRFPALGLAFPRPEIRVISPFFAHWFFHRLVKITNKGLKNIAKGQKP